MKLQPLLILGITSTILFSGLASADGGGHKEVLPDETIIGISLLSSLITYFLVPKISKFELNNEQRLVSSLIMFTVVVHASLGIDDLKLLAGAAGFFAFGVAFYVLEITIVENNRKNLSYLFIVYTLAIVVFYVYLHPDLMKDGNYDLVGILTKISEIGIIGLTLKR